MPTETFLFLQAAADAPPWLLALARWSSTVLPNLALGGTALALLAGGRRGRTALLWIALAIALAWLLARGIRVAWPSARPFVQGHGTALLPHGASASFPSLHATGGAAWAAGLALLLRPRWGWTAAAAGIALLIGWSRVYLHLHYPVDVLAGWALGAGCAVAMWLLQRVVRSPYADGRIRTGRRHVRTP